MTEPVGLVLSGGGARTAFQVGVLKAISQWVDSDELPFKVVTGASAGSINAAYLAANADQFKFAVAQLTSMWGTLTSRQVYASEILSINHFKTLMNVFNKMRTGMKSTNSVLTALPLAKLLKDQIDFDRIDHCLEKKYLNSLAVTATSFQNSMSTTFVQSNQNIFWERVRRTGIEERIKVKHLMASTAIPFLFPPVKINNEFYGDGSLRNFAPLSPAIRCGAKSLIVVGIREIEDSKLVEKQQLSFGDIFSKILNTILFDSLDVDNERLNRINQTIKNAGKKTRLKNIDTVIIRPSVDFREMVKDFDYETPIILNQLLKLLGSKNNTDLKSYLMFEPGYLNALIDQGYKDAHSYKARIIEMLNKKSSRVGGDNPREL